MPTLPKLSGKELLKILKSIEFKVTRIKGSHHILKHKDARMTVVPVHSNEKIGPGLLIKILNDCKITKEDFIKFF